MRSTARRGLVLLSLALLVFSPAAFAQEPPPQTYRLDLSTVVGDGQVDRDPAGVEGAPGVYYYHGAPLDVTITAVPDEGWGFKEWEIGETGEPTETREEATTVVSFVPDATDWTAVAVFAVEYTVTATAGEGGTIDPEDAVPVLDGEDVTFTITPDAGYAIDDVLVDDVSVYDELVFLNSAATYTLENVTDDHTIHATFVLTHEEFCQTFGEGWTLFGLSADPLDTDPESFAVDPTPMFTYLYRWDPETRRYMAAHRDEITELEGLYAYWMYLSRENATYQVCIEGTAFTGLLEIQLGSAGWQMVGVPYAVAWGDAAGGSMRFRNNGDEKSLAEALDAGWILSTIYAWDSLLGEWIRYRIADGATLVPWTGYFLYTMQDDLELIFTEDEAVWPAGFKLSPASLAFDPGEPPVPMLPGMLPADGLAAVAYPSPVVDGRAVTFTVRGIAARYVDGLRVNVLAMSGQPVYRAETPQASLSWDTMGPTGSPVASGVYLYTLEAKVQGQWVSVGMEKVLILR